MNRDSAGYQRLVVFCPNLIGDAVMATPMFRAIRETWPDARITAVMKPQVAPVFDNAPWIDRKVFYSSRARDRKHRLLPAVLNLRQEKAQVGLVLPGSFRSALLLWLAGIPNRVGYARGGRSALLTKTIEPAVITAGGYLPVPAVEYYLALARSIGAVSRSPRTELFTTEQDERTADEVWARLGISTDRPVVCLNTGGAFGPAKNWPLEYFVTLAHGLVDQADCQVLVLCGPGERDNARSIAERAGHPRVQSLADQPLSIGLSKACVRRASLLVTTDSGPRHFAGPFGTPVVSLFGPTHIGWTRTYHPNSIHLQQPVPCGPCQKPTCAEGHHRCMVELTPDVVLRASLRLLGGPATGRMRTRSTVSSA